MIRKARRHSSRRPNFEPEMPSIGVLFSSYGTCVYIGFGKRFPKQQGNDERTKKKLIIQAHRVNGETQSKTRNPLRLSIFSLQFSEG